MHNPSKDPCTPLCRFVNEQTRAMVAVGKWFDEEFALFKLEDYLHGAPQCMLQRRARRVRRLLIVREADMQRVLLFLYKRDDALWWNLSRRWLPVISILVVRTGPPSCHWIDVEAVDVLFLTAAQAEVQPCYGGGRSVLHDQDIAVVV